MGEVNSAACDEYDFSTSWECLDEKAIQGELSKSNKTIDSFSKVLLDLTKGESVCDKAEKERQKVLTEIGPAGWIHLFNRTNDSKAMHFNQPSFVLSLSPEQKKSYDMVFRYRMETNTVQDVQDQLYKLVLGMPLHDISTIQVAYYNLKDGNYTKSLYDKINNEVAAVSELISSTRFSMPRVGKMEKETPIDQRTKDWQKAHLQAKLQDYLDFFKNSPISDSIVHRGNGNFSLKADAHTRAKIIDAYTKEITSVSSDFEGKLKKTIEGARKLKEETIPLAKKGCKIAAVLDHLGWMSSLADMIYTCSVLTNDNREKFSKGDSEAPFCFMQILPALVNVKHNYNFWPLQDRPTSTGTKYEDFYTKAKDAVTKHCQDLVFGKS